MLRVLVVWLMVLSMAGCASFGGDDVDDIVDELEDLAKEAEDGFYAVSTALGVLLCALPPDERRQWSAEIRQCQRPEDIECNGPAPFDFPGFETSDLARHRTNCHPILR